MTPVRWVYGVHCPGGTVSMSSGVMVEEDEDAKGLASATDTDVAGGSTVVASDRERNRVGRREVMSDLMLSSY